MIINGNGKNRHDRHYYYYRHHYYHQHARWHLKQGPFTKTKTTKMRAMGDVYSDIERMTRLLEENRAASDAIIKRIAIINMRPGHAAKENMTLQRMLEKLSKKEEEMQRDIEGLLVFVLKHQIGKQKLENNNNDDSVDGNEL